MSFRELELAYHDAVEVVVNNLKSELQALVSEALRRAFGSHADYACKTVFTAIAALSRMMSNSFAVDAIKHKCRCFIGYRPYCIRSTEELTRRLKEYLGQPQPGLRVWK